jgi:hypothetical protein
MGCERLAAVVSVPVVETIVKDCSSLLNVQNYDGYRKCTTCCGALGVCQVGAREVLSLVADIYCRQC